MCARLVFKKHGINLDCVHYIPVYIMNRNPENANPHSRGVILERVGSWCGHGGCRRNLQKVAETVAGAHQRLSMTSRSGSWNMQIPIAGA
jgi:hypothetical protein